MRLLLVHPLYFCLLLLLLLIRQRVAAVNEECVSLNKCSAVQWLIQHQLYLDRLGGLQCGFGGDGQVMVLCPRVRTDVMSESVHLSGRNVFTLSNSAQRSRCFGRLSLYTIQPDNGHLRVFNLAHTSYTSLNSLLQPDTTVYRVRVDGNCCWHLHRRPYFRLEGHSVRLGFDATPPFQPRSVRRVDCALN